MKSKLQIKVKFSKNNIFQIFILCYLQYFKKLKLEKFTEVIVRDIKTKQKVHNFNFVWNFLIKSEK